MNPDNFGKNLKNILANLKMSQVELSVDAGLHESTISFIIEGVRQPKLRTICAILEVLPVNFEDLVKDDL